MRIEISHFFMIVCMHMIYVICGPTGSGKTEIAIKFSDYFRAPIINADAFQIYQDMNIGTAKISKDDSYHQKHYLLDIKKPSENFSVMEYQKLFRECLDRLLKDNENIIVCGGTGLYIKAALYDYVFNEEEPVDNSDLDELSNEELYKMLVELDEESTKSIHPNNRKRIIRAISIARNQKFTKSENISSQEHKMLYSNVKFLFLNPDRTKLYENINKRVDVMLENGLVDEVKGLLKKYELSVTARAAIGYKEVIDYLDGQYSLEDCSELIKKRSRNYAKRQVTFFKNQFPVETYNSKEELLKRYIKEVQV